MPSESAILAGRGALEPLKILYSDGTEVGNDAIIAAARNGKTEVLRWMASVGIGFDDIVIEAAMGSPSTVLCMTRDCGVQPDRVFWVAMTTGNIDSFRFLAECEPMSDATKAHARELGLTDFVEWIRVFDAAGGAKATEADKTAKAKRAAMLADALSAALDADSEAHVAVIAAWASRAAVSADHDAAKASFKARTALAAKRAMNDKIDFENRV